MMRLRFLDSIRFLPCLLLLGATSAYATTGTWQTDLAAGINQVEMTVHVACPATGFICDQVDDYSDTQISS
ncbi:MAG: hypothetical protein VX252_05940, partial [Myxococcota bacterium]|nr:hypothetical protein [Myxococcota bacterium]